MMNQMMNYLQMSNWGFYAQGWATFGFLLLIAWTLVWKGIALWKASHLNQRTWFVILLVLNTAGILDIIYIFAVAKKKEKTAPQTQM